MDLNSIALLVSVVAVGGSFVYACVNVGRVAGSTDSRLASLSDGLAELSKSLRAFADKADERLTDHGERIAALEGRRHTHARASDHESL